MRSFSKERSQRKQRLEDYRRSGVAAEPTDRDVEPVGRPVELYEPYDPADQSNDESGVPSSAEFSELDPVAVPNVIIVMGRHSSRENADLMGEYYRITDFCKKPAYKKPGTMFCLKYWAPADRWVIDRGGLRNQDVCSAYSEQSDARDPMAEELVWRVWESTVREHVCDPHVFITSAPRNLMVCCPKDSLQSIGGQYVLSGLHQGRVFYTKEGGKHVIRYFHAAKRWLIDAEGLRSSDVCSAYADVTGEVGRVHPGVRHLWHSWDAEANIHRANPALVCCECPRYLILGGRGRLRDFNQINGVYLLHGLFHGRPAYVKAGGKHAIRYWPREDRWLLDLQGLRSSDSCSAFAEAHDGQDHPASISLIWHIWEPSRSRFIVDGQVRTTTAPVSISVEGRLPLRSYSEMNGVYLMCGFHDGLAYYKKDDADHEIRYDVSLDQWIVDLGFDPCNAGIHVAFANARGTVNPANADLVWHVWEPTAGSHMPDAEIKMREGHPNLDELAEQQAKDEEALDDSSNTCSGQAESLQGQAGSVS